MAFTELNLLGMKVEGKYFIDCALPFGASILCKIFEDVASLIPLIVERRVGHKLVHYLDDFSPYIDSTWYAATLCQCSS